MKAVHALPAVLLGTALSTFAWDSSENAVWLEGTLKGKIADNLGASLKEQVRYKESDGFFFLRYTDFGLSWKFSNAWSLSGNYRYVSTRSRTGDWYAKPMLHANLVNTLPLGAVKLKTRLRLAHVQLSDAPDQAYLWPRFILSPASAWKGMSPYGAWEPIYEMNSNLLYRNRIEGGILYAPTDLLSLKLFLMQQITRTSANSDWTEAYNMGAGMTLKF